MIDETVVEEEVAAPPKPRAQKTVFAYHPVTKEFMGESIAYESPLEPGVFHLPANTTDITPGAAVPNEALVWSDTSWRYASDLRGKTVYAKDDAGYGSARTITELGQVPSGYTLLQPATARDKWSGNAWVSPATDFDNWNGTAFVTDMAALKRWKKDRILSEQTAVADELTADYTWAEVATWTLQYIEAMSYQANNKTETPLLLALAQARGITVSELADKVLAKAGMYQNAIAELIARHRARDAAVDAATTVAAVQAS